MRSPGSVGGGSRWRAAAVGWDNNPHNLTFVRRNGGSGRARRPQRGSGCARSPQQATRRIKSQKEIVPAVIDFCRSFLHVLSGTAFTLGIAGKRCDSDNEKL